MRKLRCQIRAMNQVAFQKLLREHFSASQLRNPGFSVRAFARRLDLGLGTVSEVLARKRTLSVKSATKALDRLGIGPAERTVVFNSPKKTITFAHTQLESDQYFILSEWYYLAILNLIRTKDFKPTAKHISARLGISLTLAGQAIDRLLRVNLVRMENKKMIRTSVALKTTDGIPDLALRKSHYQTLERARMALDEHPFGTFDASWLTFAFSPKDMKLAQEKIRDFQDEFAEQFSFSKEPSEVYRLAVQLFSLTVPLKSGLHRKPF